MNGIRYSRIYTWQTINKLKLKIENISIKLIWSSCNFRLSINVFKPGRIAWTRNYSQAELKRINVRIGQNLWDCWEKIRKDGICAESEQIRNFTY